MRPSSSRVFAIIRGGATMYMAITGVVFALLLANADVQLTLPWVNDILHVYAPLIVVLDWCFDAPKVRLAGVDISWWFIYPLAWLLYTLVRGPLVNWYPYPFLDPSKEGGYARVTAYCIGIFVFGIVVAGLLNGIAILSRGIAGHQAA